MSCASASTLALADDPRFQRLKDQLIATTGLAYYRNKDAVLCERLSDRLAQLELPEAEAYWDLLDDDDLAATELEYLVEQLTIGETSFFRHRELFDALRDVVLPEVIERNQIARRLRIWSAGCSFGPEAYSISILLRREFAARISGWDINILGTDINRDFLRRAREGYFDEWAFRGVPDEIKQECFTPTGKGQVINPRFREGVTFEHHNLVEPLDRSSAYFLGSFDVIFCRNVMIYFSGEMIRQLVHGLHQNLTEGGWLLVGHAEPNIETFRSFIAVNAPGAVLYRKSTEPPANHHAFIGSAACAIADNEDCPRVALANRKPASISAVEPRAATLDDLRSMADGGDLHSALRLCDDLLEAEPLDVPLHQYHALILGQLGRHHEAEQALRRAIYLDRDAALAHYYLGVLRQQRGSHEEAARSFGNTLRALERCRPDETLRDGDDMTASDLERLARARLKDIARP